MRVGSLDPAEAPITLMQEESSVIYSAGHLLFARGESLMAHGFDVDVTGC